MELEPTTYYDAVQSVLACVNQSLIDNEVNGTLGEPGRVVAVPGNEVPWDGCGCGQLAIAFQHGPYPSTTFPIENQDGGQNGNCILSSSAVRCIMSLTRCEYHPQGPESPKKAYPPTVIQQNAATRLQQIEQFYMRQSLLCCLQTLVDDDDIDDFRIGASDYAVNGACGETSIIFWMGVF